MSTKGTAGLFFLATGTIMNSAKYLEMLKDKLEIHLAVHGCDTCRTVIPGTGQRYPEEEESQKLGLAQ